MTVYWTDIRHEDAFAMARTVQDAKIGSREARGKLKVSGKPYYRLIDQGLHLG